MGSVKIIRSASRGSVHLVISMMMLAASACYGALLIKKFEWIWVVAVGCFAVNGIIRFLQWFKPRRGHWLLFWNGSRIRITNGSHVDYEGDLDSMYLIDEDGMGYFLYPTAAVVYRLKRKDSGPELDALLSVDRRKVEKRMCEFDSGGPFGREEMNQR
jgi:hypothetical protein